MGYTDDGDGKLYNLLNFYAYGTFNEWCGPTSDNAFVGYIKAMRVEKDDEGSNFITHALNSTEMAPLYMNSDGTNSVEG